MGEAALAVGATPGPRVELTARAYEQTVPEGGKRPMTSTLFVLSALLMPGLRADGQVSLVASFEARAEMTRWSVGAGAQADLVHEHVTHGRSALRLRFPNGRGVLRLNGPLNWKGWELLKIDLYNPGDPFTMTFRADDQKGGTISSWYHLIRTGKSTIDVHVRGLAEGIDTSRIAWCHIRVDPVRPKSCEVYMDNWRLTRGIGTETWQPQIPPQQRPPENDSTNLLPNGEFELGLHGWGSWGLWDGGEYRFGSGTGKNAYSGAHSAAIYCVRKGRGGIFSSSFSVPAQATYTLRVWAKGSEPGDVLISYEGQRHRKFQPGRVDERWQTLSLTIDLPAGEEGRVYLYSKSGGTVYFDRAYFGAPGVHAPRPPVPAGRLPRVQVRGDKVFINGRPFFCRGIYRARPRDLAGTPFNLVPGWDARGGYEDVPPGVWIMPDFTGLARAHILYQLPLAIAPLAEHPAVIGWYVCDEPDHEKWPVGPDEIKFATQLAHERDPNRITMTVVMPWAASNLYRFADSVDVLATDSYPISDKKPSKVLAVAQATDWAVHATRGEKPVWLVVQGTAKATPGEEYAVTYLALTHGADGILYWEYEDAHRRPEIWQTILRLGHEMQALENALVAQDAAQQPAPSDSRIHCLAKQTAEWLYVLCINSSHEPVGGVTIEVGHGLTGTAEVMFESRNATVRDGAIIDDFGPYQRHVYRIRL